MSFEACMARSWPGITDKEAFCATMERGELSKAAIEKAACPRPVYIAKLDEEKRLVTAIVATVTKANGVPLVDAQDDVTPIEEIEKAFIDGFAHGGTGHGDEMHERFGVADVVQHFTISRDEWAGLAKGMGIELPLMPEIAIVKMRVHDDALWRRVKAGLLPEISYTGGAYREAV